MFARMGWTKNIDKKNPIIKLLIVNFEMCVIQLESRIQKRNNISNKKNRSAMSPINGIILLPSPHRRLLPDNIQRGSWSAVERDTAVSCAGVQPGCAVHVLRGHETKSRTWRPEGEGQENAILHWSVCEITPMFHVSGQISSLEIFLIGAVAKAVATSATYPLQTVQAILRVTSSVRLH